MWNLLAYLGLSESMRRTDWLVSAAEFSNLISFLSVVLSFTAMFFFLIRLIGEDMFGGVGAGGVTRLPVVPPRVNFAKILLPFRVKLIGVKEPYRIELRVTAVREGRCRVYWGVDINAFHQVLRAPQSWFHSAFSLGNLFGKGKCVQFGEIRDIQKVEDGDLCFHKPEDALLQLGAAPRDVYPCVVVVVCRDSALLSAVHVRDPQCSVPSQILAEYYKHGETSTLLKPLFMASIDLGETSDTESQEESETEDESGMKRGSRVPRCIICQQGRISRVLLPCRHATSCAQCFKRLESCPMCRGFIQSYFVLGKEPDQVDPSPSADTQPSTARGWMAYLAGLRHWINGPLVLENQN